MRLEFDLDERGKPVGKPVPSSDAALVPSRSRTLPGRYCRVEPLDLAVHGADLWDAFADDTTGSTWTYLGIGPFDSFEPFEQWLVGATASTDPFFYAIIDGTTGRAVGFVSYLRIDPGSRAIEVGWITYSPRMQRSRVATDTMFLMMREAFALGYRRYEWKCNALNAPSIAAAHRLGFSFEGLFRHAAVVKGRNRDTAWFSVVDRDWPMLEAAFQRWLSPDNFDDVGNQRTRLSDLTAPVVESRWPTLTVER
jgi:RimJ/RimL family protein N-acetyltransferase